MDEHFRARIVERNGCWIWTGSVNSSGYGVVSRGGKLFVCHRFAFERARNVRLLSSDVVVRACGKKLCVNPDHLQISSKSDRVALSRHRSEQRRALAEQERLQRQLHRPTVDERFWSKVEKRAESECWPWLAAKFNCGYGAFGLNGRHVGAHRVAFILATHQEIPDGLWVLHSCDNRECCNPAHLRLGTRKDNVCDMISRGRANFQSQEFRERVLPMLVAISNRAPEETTRSIAERLGVTMRSVQYNLKKLREANHGPR